MPLTVDLQYEYFTQTWLGRIKVVQLFLGVLCLMLAAPAYYATQHWFLLVVATVFLGTVFFSLYYLCLDTYLRDVETNWLQNEFWFTALAAFLYFTAFVAQLVDFSGYDGRLFETWYDVQVAAGVMAMFNDLLYVLTTYFLYLEWKASPGGLHGDSDIPAGPGASGEPGSGSPQTSYATPKSDSSRPLPANPDSDGPADRVSPA